MSEAISLPPSYTFRPIDVPLTAPLSAPSPTLAVPPRARPVRQDSFVKQSKKRDLSLQLLEQHEDGSLPVYGLGTSIQGSVEVEKADGVQAVRLRVKGTLLLRELGGEGTQHATLCLHENILWKKGGPPCPKSLQFSLELPESFSDDKDEYPLPPTYEVELPGVPGFHAEIAYAIEATLVKGKSNPITKALGLGNPTVSTPFIYRCRTRPAAPLPAPLSCSPVTHGFRDDPRWTTTEAKITSRIDAGQDIAVKLHLPRLKIFSITELIPFHADFVGSAISLATFMSFGPMPAGFGSPMTTIRIIRRSNCDIRNQEIDGTRTDMWRTEVIGSGTFERAGDGSDWMSLNGRLNVSDRITVGGFRAGGLFVKDYVVLSMVPPEPHRAPFREFRVVVPIRLTTDPWVEPGKDYAPSNFSVPSDPEDYVEALPQLSRGW